MCAFNPPTVHSFYRAQAEGGVGNAQLIDDQPNARHPVLLYRLVGGLVKSDDNPWGGGKLLELAETHSSDNALKTACYMLLSRPWRQDPIRRVHVLPELLSESVFNKERPAQQPKHLAHSGGIRVSSNFDEGFNRLKALKSMGKLGSKFSSLSDGETWGTVLVHGRGTVGETALHLLFLLGSPQVGHFPTSHTPVATSPAWRPLTPFSLRLLTPASPSLLPLI